MMNEETPPKLSYTSEHDTATEVIRCKLPRKDYRAFAGAPPPSRVEFEVVADPEPAEPAPAPQSGKNEP
jgi:hypothetical protein